MRTPRPGQRATRRRARVAAGGAGHVAHVVRVALAAAAVVAVAYAAAVTSFDLADGAHLLHQVDRRLGDVLVDARSHSGTLSPPRTGEDDGDDLVGAPVLLWRVAGDGTVTALSGGAPPLPRRAWRRSPAPTTAQLAAGMFRLRATRVGSAWLVAGESLAATARVENTLDVSELVAGPTLVLVAFGGALLLGLTSAAPVEQARRRQRDFTADASHELRTPLSVIEAEVGLALGTGRDAEAYRVALGRVGDESRRLRRIVEDLLWLARFDAEPPVPPDEPVDVATIAQRCVERFAALAASRSVAILAEVDTAEPPLVDAPPEWIDRLLGVLVDNACRHGGSGGLVRVAVRADHGRVVLAVEDDGPGLPPELRSRVFDRFQRSDAASGGAGLGLSIADAVVARTGGRWQVGSSPRGGARFEVRWRNALSRGPAGGRMVPRRRGGPTRRRRETAAQSLSISSRIRSGTSKLA